MSPLDLENLRRAVEESTNASRQMKESIERLTAGFVLRHDYLATNEAVAQFAKQWKSVMSPDILHLQEQMASFPKLLGMDTSELQRQASAANEAIKSLTTQWRSVMEPDLLQLKESFAVFPKVLGVDVTGNLLAKYAASLHGINTGMLEGLETPLLASKLDVLTNTALFPDVSSAAARVALGLGGSGNFATAQLTSLAAEASVAQLPWEALGERFGISARARFSLQHSTRRLQRRYTDLIDAESRSDGDTVSASDAPLSMLAHGQSLRVMTTDSPTDALVVGIRVDVVNATFVAVEDWLDDVNPQWAEMLRGARERAVLRGADWPRHWASSYRQLLKDVLHAAAPSEVVKPWVTEKSDLDSKGFPKRRTKVRWLCRNEPERQRRFLVEDIDSALGILGVLEETVHEDDTNVIESEFHWLSLRIEKAMHDILRLWPRG